MHHAAPALVTGASRGLGRALARRLARRGHPVVLVARHAEPLLALAREIERDGGTAHVVPGDVGDPDDVLSIAARATALVSRVDLLVHNASTLGPLPMPLLADTRAEDLQRVLEVNLLGPFRLTRALLGGLALGEGGTVLHISSDAAVEAYPGWGAYSISKAALDHLARLWSAELAELGVRVLAVDPGEMDTRMHADAIPDADRSTLADPDDVAARILAMLEAPIPAGARVQASQWEARP